MSTRRANQIDPPCTSAQGARRGTRSNIISEESEESSSEETTTTTTPSVDQSIRALILAEIEPVRSSEIILPLTAESTVATVNIGAFPRSCVGRYRIVFQKVNSAAAWNHIAQKTSEKLQEKVRAGGSKQNARKYYSKAVTAKEIQVVLGLEIIFRGRRNITSYKEQFQTLPPDLNEWPIAEKRFKAILGSLAADFTILSAHLRQSWKSAINPGSECSVDEAIFDFFSQADQSSPQRFIPRKPHPNGLLCFYGGFKTQHGPFMFDLEPDYEINSLNSRTALQRMMARWEWQQTPHVFVDAGFSGEETLDTLADLKIPFTASVNIMHRRGLYDVLHSFCGLKKWIAVTDKNGFVWSLLRGDSDTKEQFLVTSGFQTERAPKRTKIIDESQQKSLEGVGKRGLILLAAKLGIQIQENVPDLARSIADFANSSVPTEEPMPTHSTAGGARRIGDDEGVGHHLTEAQLKIFTVAKLNSVARDLGVRKARKKKDELIQAILKAQNITGRELVEFKALLKEAEKPVPAPQHEKYHDHFNAIDIHDKRWNYLQNHHVVRDWTAKFVLSLMQTGIVNSWTVQRSFEEVSFQDFLNELAVQLCQQ